MRLTRGRVKALHVKQASRGSKRIAQAVGEILRAQFKAAAADLESGGIASAEAIFKPADWNAPLRAAARPAIGHVMLQGALAELRATLPLVRRIGGQKRTSAQDAAERYGIDLPDGIALEMPAALIEKIEAAIDDSLEQEFWEGISETTRENLAAILKAGATGGDSIRKLAKRIEAMGESYSRTRATLIARTESTRSLNAGHHETIAALADETGLAIGKEWLSVLGATTRVSHADMDGQQVGPGEQFILAGVPCDYPGDAALPAEEAVNCLCTVVSSIAADSMRDEEPADAADEEEAADAL